MVHRIIATITVTLVCGTKLFNLTLFTRLLNYERSSRRWNLMSLSLSWPSRANSALPPISGNNAFLPWPDLCNDLNNFCSQPYYVCTSARQSHCLRYWPLNYTGFFIRFCIKALPLDVDIKVPYVFHVSVSEYILSRSDRIKPFTACPPSFVWKFSTSLSWKLQDKPRGTGNQQTACSRSFFKHELFGICFCQSLRWRELGSRISWSHKLFPVCSSVRPCLWSLLVTDVVKWWVCGRRGYIEGL